MLRMDSFRAAVTGSFDATRTANSHVRHDLHPPGRFPPAPVPPPRPAPPELGRHPGKIAWRRCGGRVGVRPAKPVTRANNIPSTAEQPAAQRETNDEEREETR